MESTKVTIGGRQRGRRSRRYTRKQPRSQRVNNWAKEAGKYYKIHKGKDPKINEFSDVLKSPKFKAYYHSKYGSGESKGRFSKTRRIKKDADDAEPMSKENNDWDWGWDSDTKKFKKDANVKEEYFQKDELFQGGKKNNELLNGGKKKGGKKNLPEESEEVSEKVYEKVSEE
jgi:hypothetical protein